MNQKQFDRIIEEYILTHSEEGNELIEKIQVELKLVISNKQLFLRRYKKE